MVDEEWKPAHAALVALETVLLAALELGQDLLERRVVRFEWFHGPKSVVGEEGIVGAETERRGVDFAFGGERVVQEGGLDLGDVKMDRELLALFHLHFILLKINELKGIRIYQ